MLDDIRLAAAAFRPQHLRLADLSSDVDHNRSVVSLIGCADALKSMVGTLFSIAEQYIDMSRHRGHHPRVGAVDVVPFVPLWDTPMSEAIDLAQQVAGQVAQQFELPVYLYEQAARLPERRELPKVRKGQLEGIASQLARGENLPDFGPPRVHPRLGAAIVGARLPLVAYNIVLDSDNLEVAKQIAVSLRQTQSNGLAGVRALPIKLDSKSKVQISMNLTQPQTVGLMEVFIAVSQRAAQLGLTIESSELIGLTSSQVLRQGLEQFLKTKILPTQILEHHFQNPHLTAEPAERTIWNGAR